MSRPALSVRFYNFRRGVLDVDKIVAGAGKPATAANVVSLNTTRPEPLHKEPAREDGVAHWMVSRLRPTVQKVQGCMRTAVERISRRPVVEIALELGRDKQPNPCPPGRVDKVELLRVRDGRDEKVDSLEGIS